MVQLANTWLWYNEVIAAVAAPADLLRDICDLTTLGSAHSVGTLIRSELVCGTIDSLYSKTFSAANVAVTAFSFLLYDLRRCPNSTTFLRRPRFSDSSGRRPLPRALGGRHFYEAPRHMQLSS